MNCEQARKEWGLFHDCEGDAGLHREISEHLATCRNCVRWFEQQSRLEDAISGRLHGAEPADGIWQRIHENYSKTVPGFGQRHRLLSWTMFAAALILVAMGVPMWNARHRDVPDTGLHHLSVLSAALHQELADGHRAVDFSSRSDVAIEGYLQQSVGFPVHCPPRKDVEFEVSGAGSCFVNRKPAAFIVGKVGTATVSLFVLEKESLNAFPHDRDALSRGNGRHRCREGMFEMVSGVTADNVVVVVGAVPTQTLEKLLDAYGSYHESHS